MKFNWGKLFKVITPALTALIFLGAILIFINSEHRSEVDVQNHTQTLQELRSAVEELKANNAVDHQQTVTYINCVLVGITNTPSQAQALLVYQECLTNAGIDTTK